MHIATDHIRDAKMDLLMMEDIPTGAARRAGTSPQGLDTLHG